MHRHRLIDRGLNPELRQWGEEEYLGDCHSQDDQPKCGSVLRS